MPICSDRKGGKTFAFLGRSVTMDVAGKGRWAVRWFVCGCFGPWERRRLEVEGREWLVNE